MEIILDPTQAVLIVAAILYLGLNWIVDTLALKRAKKELSRCKHKLSTVSYIASGCYLGIEKDATHKMAKWYEENYIPVMRKED